MEGAGETQPLFLMAKMILDYDPLTAISHWVDTDEETGITSYGADQDATAILDWNKALFNHDHGKWGEFTHVASIPNVLFVNLVMRGILGVDGHVFDQDEFKKELKKILNDSDYQKLRTRPGVI